MSNNTTDTILGYNQQQAEAVSSELQNTVMDLITLSESQGTDVAVDTVVTGLTLRIAILDGLISPKDAEKLVLDTDGNFVQITTRLQDLAFAKFFGA
jgi:hypothetical protein